MNRLQSGGSVSSRPILCKDGRYRALLYGSTHWQVYESFWL